MPAQKADAYSMERDMSVGYGEIGNAVHNACKNTNFNIQELNDLLEMHDANFVTTDDEGMRYQQI